MRNGKRLSKGGWDTNGIVRKKMREKQKERWKRKEESGELGRRGLYGSKEGKEMKKECKYREEYEG